MCKVQNCKQFKWEVFLSLLHSRVCSLSSIRLQLGLYLHFVSKGWVVYKQCCHVNLENRQEILEVPRSSSACGNQVCNMLVVRHWLLKENQKLRSVWVRVWVCILATEICYLLWEKDFLHVTLFHFVHSTRSHQRHTRQVIHMVMVGRPWTPLWKILGLCCGHLDVSFLRDRLH